jgi:phage baseplate assembly protein W
MTDIPHFALPFRFQTPAAAVVEQDSLDEIAGCVLAILACPLGFRVELPDFGVPDLTFEQQPVDTASVRALVEEWEPRAGVLFSQHPNALDVAIARLEALVSVRTEE